MSFLMPTDRAVLAAAVADCLVVSADPYAREASVTFWNAARPWHDRVIAAIRGADDLRVRDLAGALIDDPASPERHAALRAALREAKTDDIAGVFDLAWQAECHSRLGFHLGRRYRPDGVLVTADEVRSWSPGRPSADPGAAEILIVVPFRDRGTGGERLRNLLSCLLALRDQSTPREHYRVLVVESDDTPRWQEIIEPFADSYLFAEKPGKFNKSWAVNAGVVNALGRAEAICILDADVLVDRDFVARNAARLRRPGTGGHLPYRDMLCVDATATSWAIRERLTRRCADIGRESLRGFAVRRPVGCCLWVRAEAFLRIGGMDERFEGWGGEDNDFAYRFDMANAFDSFEDLLVHMYHPASSREDGWLLDSEVPALSWRPSEPIGRLDRFSADPSSADPSPHRRTDAGIAR